MRKTWIGAAVVVVVFAVAAFAETYQVSDLKALAEVVGEKANPGDVVEIAPGTYWAEAKTINVLRSGTSEAPIVIRGVVEEGARPVIDAAKVNIQRGIITFPQETHDVVLESLELRNAEGGGHEGAEYPRNAAGVYILGSNITLRDCVVHHSENGLFSTHESDFVLIDRCDIGWNGRKPGFGDPHRTHNFYFNSKHQMVKNSYIHHSTDSQNWKSRGGNTIFAFNWVDEDYAYSMGADSNNDLNTLWLGNVAVKRTYPGINQGRLLGIGDGTGVVKGVIVALNNTFVTSMPRDFYLFTEKSSTADVYAANNVFAGPGESFLDKNGQGKIEGANNWVASAAGDVPAELTGTLRGEEPGFANAAGFDYRLKEGSPLIDAGVTQEEYVRLVKLVTQNSREGEGGKASSEWLKALEEIERPAPSFSPARKGAGVAARVVTGAIDIGAYEYPK